MHCPLIAGVLPCFIVLTLCHLLVEDFCSYLQAAPLVQRSHASHLLCSQFCFFWLLGSLGKGEISLECSRSSLLPLLVRWLFPFIREMFPPSVPLYCPPSSVWCWLYLIPLCVDGFAFLSHSTSALQCQVVFLSQTSHFSVPVPGFFSCISYVWYMHHSCGWSCWTMKCYEFLLFQQMILC